ncbi:MAG TPA: hypothetical protein VJ001_12495 [Rhodocyclaceae bacterium]|nr:hypothetical protein [Rhodocyclaceae bacterium]
MHPIIGKIKSIAILLSMAILLVACDEQEKLSEASFIGKWRSSKIPVPFYLHANGEWEIRLGEGEVMEYGVWQVVGKNILWSYKDQNRNSIMHDLDPVVALTPISFKVRENDGAITTFTRLE